jgi:hypothetical protein
VIQWGIERLTLLSNAKAVKVKTCETADDALAWRRP